jgi:zinc finger protein
MREDREVLGSRLAKLSEMKTVCPSCKSEHLVLEDYLYEVPHVGRVIITSGRCSRCGYRFTDVRLAEAKPARRLVMRVDGGDDLNALVVRASTSSVYVPELGLEMKPGPASQGFITTVEGLLMRFLEALHVACSAPDADKDLCKRKEREITEAMRGRRRFTLVIEDPEGVSTIVSSKAVVEPLQGREEP